MCMGGPSLNTNTQQQQQAATPAPAPPAPAPLATPEAVGATRAREDLALFGTSRPSLRVDRSATSGGVGQGGSGVAVH